jgi:hypothetical protein
MTKDDAAVLERLRALHRGSGPIRVRRMIERQTGSPPSALANDADDLAGHDSMRAP